MPRLVQMVFKCSVVRFIDQCNSGRNLSNSRRQVNRMRGHEPFGVHVVLCDSDESVLHLVNEVASLRK